MVRSRGLGYLDDILREMIYLKVNIGLRDRGLLFYVTWFYKLEEYLGKSLN